MNIKLASPSLTRWLTADDVPRLWVVIPALIMFKLGKDIIWSIDVAARESGKKASGKAQ